MCNMSTRDGNRWRLGERKSWLPLLLQRIFSDDIMRSNYHMESQLSVLGKVSLLKDTLKIGV